MEEGNMALARSFLLTLFAFLIAPQAGAQPYPARPVQVIVSNTPGSSADLVARLTMGKFSSAFSQQFVVVNRPGGGGAIGAQTLVRAAPDGYTLLVMADA